jgi:hypothetical protein
VRRFLWFVGALVLLQATAVSAEPGEVISSLLKVPLPSRLQLCGEEVPLSREDVAERLEIEVMVALSNPVSASLWFKRRERFFPLIEEKIREKGLPMDLRYVPVVESNLRAEALSSARAVGPWQFMRGTGRTYGLERTTWRDDRRNWEKATDAGLSHLKDLYDDLGSWPLALAAYNAGKRRVAGAMERQGQEDFYGLRLPKETERYVFKVMAVKMILERPEGFGIRLEGARLYAPEKTVALTIKVDRPRLPLSVVADAAGVSYRRMRTLNPWITSDALPKGTSTVKIPAAAKGTFREALARWETDNPMPKVVYYKVRRGDTLSGIANRHGVQLNDLLAWNSLHSRSVIHPGQSIAVRRTN